MRLIDGEELERLFNEQIERGATDAFDAFDDALQDTPNVDAEVVVRCKDCKHSWEDLGGLTCSHGVCVDCVVLGDFYCANGERKKGADNG